MPCQKKLAEGIWIFRINKFTQCKKYIKEVKQGNAHNALITVPMLVVSLILISSLTIVTITKTKRKRRKEYQFVRGQVDGPRFCVNKPANPTNIK